MALADDILASIDRRSPHCVRIYEVHNGHQIHSVEHRCEIMDVALSRGALGERRLAILDRNKDLYIARCSTMNIGTSNGANVNGLEKLASHVEDFLWHDTTDMLLAISDGMIVTFLYPDVVYVDSTLMEQTKIVKPLQVASSSKKASGVSGSSGAADSISITSFVGCSVTLRLADGAQLSASIPPYPLHLYTAVA